VGFFATRLRYYTLATASITLFVLLCFNQIGNGYEVMWPRLLDTLIGAGIAALAIYLVLPDWRGRQLAEVLAESLRSDARYLAQILAQYAKGKHDDLPYRIARRDAHNADAALSGQFAAMLREPERDPLSREALLRFLTSAHLLLGQLSALGAHRQAMPADAAIAVQAAGQRVVTVLERLADRFACRVDVSLLADEEPNVPATSDATARFVLDQLARMTHQFARLAECADALRTV
jgi:uncharacterized membrane protein YccC